MQAIQTPAIYSMRLATLPASDDAGAGAVAGNSVPQRLQYLADSFSTT